MHTITLTVYNFDELSDTAKEKARDWYREVAAWDNDAFDRMIDDASHVGLIINSLSANFGNEGYFSASAEACAIAILAEHGEACETYKTALRFQVEHEEADFLRDLLEDYSVMLNQELAYQRSDEYVDEQIGANAYTFTIDGKREG
jgi:hypothetical protein